MGIEDVNEDVLLKKMAHAQSSTRAKIKLGFEPYTLFNAAAGLSSTACIMFGALCVHSSASCVVGARWFVVHAAGKVDATFGLLIWLSTV